MKTFGCVCDLGIYVDFKLNFSVHINNLVLGLVIWNSRSFRDPGDVSILYKSIVGPQLEYGSVVCNPLYRKYAKLDHIQSKFLRCLYFRIIRS